ncbi:MAG TPA: hypothetical protein VLC53_15955 [Myxococcota bacterium]|nr:hypothetical protein [Myxococcota bacterium]
MPGAPVDNPYFPLLDPRTRVFEGGDERFELTVLGPGPEILGVRTTTQRDRAFEDGLLVEETFDFFAQDAAGNVWYFGEDVTNYVYDDMGNLVGTNDESTWRAGVNDALPGFIMPADLTIGFNYYQEFAPDDDAIDDATTHAVGLDVPLDIGDFTDVLRVFETNALEPDAREFKYYAPGQGLILVEEGLDPDLENPDLVLSLVEVVPAPRSVGLLGVGIVALWLQRRIPTSRA